MTDLAELRVHYPFNGGRGDRYAHGGKMDWPKCDRCGEVMTQYDVEPYVASFRCAVDDFTLSFQSCRYSDRYCAWDWLIPDPPYD